MTLDMWHTRGSEQMISDLINEFRSIEGVCRTAPATPDLLKSLNKMSKFQKRNAKMAPEKKSVIEENFFKLFFTVNNWITVDCHSKSSWWPYNWFCWMRHRLWSRKRSSQKHHSYISKCLVNFQSIITLTICNFHWIGPLHWADSVSQKHPLPEVVETSGWRTYS